MRKPPPRLEELRVTDSGKQEIRDPTPSADALNAFASRARFKGISKHKKSPLRFGLPLFTGTRQNFTYCDAHAGFKPEDLASVPRWMRYGILAGLISANETGGDPTMVWAISDDGWIFEGRITIPGQALYHGYPMLPNHPFSESVIGKFALWADLGAFEDARSALDASREMYGHGA